MPTLPPIDPATITWAWETFGKEFVAAAGGGLFNRILNKGKIFAKDKWEKFEWKKAAERYRARMREQYNKVTLIGSSETVALEGVFTDVYVLDKPSAERHADLLALKTDPKAWERGAARLDAVTLVKKAEKRCLMVLGKPGAGKTTFLKHLVLEATDGRINKTPIFISLKSWADSEYSLSMNGLLTFITSQFDICGFPDAEDFVEFILQEGAALILLDGLDEINLKDSDDRDLRAKAIQTIRDFVVKFDKTQFVMTCRVAANEYQFTDFKYAEVADFNDEQIDAFVDKWFKADFKLRDSFKTEFGKPVNRGLRELAKSPILLSLVCLAYQETREFPPGRRVEIYKQAVDALMRKWDVSRGIKRDIVYKGLSQGQKENLIAHVAAQTFSESVVFIKRASLAVLVHAYLRKLARNQPEPGDGDVVLRAVEAQHGIWVERARDIYAFSHLSLQEYFAAEYVKNFAGSGALRQLLTPQHVTDDRWREVILNTVGVLGDGEEFFEFYSQTLQRMMAQFLCLHIFFDWANRKSTLYPQG